MAGLYDPYAAPIFPQGGAFGTGSPAETAQQPAGMDWLMQGITQAIGGLAKRAFGASEEMRQGGTYNPAPALEAATLPMGTGAIGVPMRAGEVALGAGPIRAYHGSPHDFDAFDLSKIGTGEGAQAYGHGLYFAENEGVAKAYKETLGGKGLAVRETVEKHLPDAALSQEDLSAIYRAALSSDKEPQAAAKSVQMAVSGLRDPGVSFMGSPGEKGQKIASAIADIRERARGKMYEVNINADPEHFLDWDKPLNQQAPQVQETLKKAMGPNWDEFKHADAGTAVKQGFIAPSPEGTAAKLSLPGIKYLDQGSRGAGEGSRNYVVFDDKLIDIMRKYGLLGLPAGGTAAPLFLGQEQKS